MDAVAVVENRARAQEADARHNLGRDPGRIGRSSRHRHPRNREDRGAEPDQDIGPEPGVLAPQLPFGPEQPAEHRGEQQPLDEFGVGELNHRRPRGTKLALVGRSGGPMLWTVVVILLVLWLLGFTLHVAGGLIHLLLVIALVVIVLRLLTGRRV